MQTMRTATANDMDELMIMATDLWPDYEYDELRNTMEELLVSPKNIIFLCCEDEQPVGFLYMGIRTDYVEGSVHSPTGYVEGIYVKPAYRKKSIAKTMLNAGEQWARERGCTQVGSDIYANNKTSYDFHLKAGFTEAGRLIAFIKNI